MSKLKELVDALEAAGVETLSVTAYGSGDDGTIDEPEIEFKEGFEEEPENLSDLIDEAFEGKGFNYYDGNGGELQLAIDVPSRTCNWSAFVNDLVMCDVASNEESV